jgi:hypothetical protein
MFNFKRSAIALSPIVVAALVAVVALSSTPSGAAALRLATGRLAVTALAAGGGGGGAGIDALTISPEATLVAKLAVSVTVSYKCRPVFDPNTGRLDIFMQGGSNTFVEERINKTTIATGSGFTNGTSVCDEGLTPTPTVNQFTVLVQPNFFPASIPFRKGSALASVSVFACPNTFVASGVPPPCDFGSAGPIVISIK